MNTARLDGRVVAIIGAGGPTHRAVAVACAEAGADVALGTVRRTQQEEYGTNSIANEIWAIGREHFVREMDASDPTQVTAFAAETWDRLGRCDALVALHDFPSDAPLDELSPDEWDEAMLLNLSAPFFAAQAFGRLMQRQHGGLIVLATPHREGVDAAYAAAKAGLAATATHVEEAWTEAGVHVRLLGAQDLLTPETVASVVVEAAALAAE